MSKLLIVMSGALMLGGASVARLALEKGDEVPSQNQVRAVTPQVLQQPAGVDRALEDSVFAAAARSAWALVEAGYQPSTGLTLAQPTWQYPTTWDIGSSLAAYYSARGLGYLSDAEYEQRTLRALQTLKTARLYKGIAYGRNYDAKTGELVGNDQKPSQNGTGFSALDLGRLLIWLKIVAQDNPRIARAASDVVARINADYVIRNGYMYGETLTKEGKLEKFQEGRIGYEQYAAAGFQLWGIKADRAAKASNNAREITVQGLPLTADRRRLDRLTSEPFILYGLEMGLTDEMREIAVQTLALQAQRFAKTGQITFASEDALNVKPYYFYYYCVYCSGKAFVINVHRPGLNFDEPRWISTKAVYGWHALMPSKYTWSGINAVKAAHVPGQGWASGVFEQSGKSTEVLSLNTAAVILEAALYRKTGEPLLRG